MTTELVITATSQKPLEGFYYYTDLGSQYTSDEFTQYIQNHHIKQSFSQKGARMIMLVSNPFMLY